MLNLKMPSEEVVISASTFAAGFIFNLLYSILNAERSASFERAKPPPKTDFMDLSETQKPEGTAFGEKLLLSDLLKQLSPVENTIYNGVHELWVMYGFETSRETRNDHYCVPRCVLFQMMKNGIHIKKRWKNKDKVVHYFCKHPISSWSFGGHTVSKSHVSTTIRQCLETFWNTMDIVCNICTDHDREKWLENYLNNDWKLDIILLEGVKLLMVMNISILWNHQKVTKIPDFVNRIKNSSGQNVDSYIFDSLDKIGSHRCINSEETNLLADSLGVKIRAFRVDLVEKQYNFMPKSRYPVVYIFSKHGTSCSILS